MIGSHLNRVLPSWLWTALRALWTSPRYLRNMRKSEGNGKPCRNINLARLDITMGASIWRFFWLPSAEPTREFVPFWRVDGLLVMTNELRELVVSRDGLIGSELERRQCLSS
jgi:hypothetical protein